MWRATVFGFLQEDDRLRVAVKEYGSERIDWKEVQQRFKLRAAKSCRLRCAQLNEEWYTCIHRYMRLLLLSPVK